MNDMTKTSDGMRKALALAAVVCAALGASAADASFLFQGRLSAVQGGTSFSNAVQIVEFNVYTNATGGGSLWARRIPVTISRTGVFGVELSDTAGTATQGGPTGSLADALALAETTGLYVGLTVQGVDREFPDRVRVGKVPEALCAVSVREPLDRDFDVGGGVVAENFEPGEALSMSNASVLGFANVPSVRSSRLIVRSTADVKGDLEVGGTVYATDVTIGGDVVAQGMASAEQVAVVSSDFSVNDRPPLCFVGMIVMWSGSPDSVPEGWEICDGHEVKDPRAVIKRVPDYTGCFVMGVSDAQGLGKTGGARTVRIQESQLPRHTHDFTFGWQGWAGSPKGGKYLLRHADRPVWIVNTDGGKGKSEGGGAPHENLPPYHALYYIMKVR